MPIVSCRSVSIAILTLVPTPSVARDEHRVAKAGALEVEQPAEAADLGVGAGARGRPHQRLDQLHHAVAGIDVDTGFGVGQGLIRHGVRFRVFVRSAALVTRKGPLSRRADRSRDR